MEIAEVIRLIESELEDRKREKNIAIEIHEKENLFGYFQGRVDELTNILKTLYKKRNEDLLKMMDIRKTPE